MNSETLRQIYNQRYSETDDTADVWSCTDPDRATEIAQGVARFCHSAIQTGNALDVGCAKGFITNAIRQLGFDSFGIDYSDVAIAQATENFPDCTFIHMDGFNPTIPNKKFSLILMRGFSGLNTYEVTDVVELLNRYLPLLTSHGSIVISSNLAKNPQRNAAWKPWTFREIDNLKQQMHNHQVGCFYGDFTQPLLKRWIHLTLVQARIKPQIPLWLKISPK